MLTADAGADGRMPSRSKSLPALLSRVPFCPPGSLAMFGGIRGVTTGSGRRCDCHLVGREARAAAVLILRGAGQWFTAEDDLAPSVSSARIEKPWFRRR